VGVWDFIGIVSVLLGLLIVLVLWIAPFVGLGLAAYYVFRGRVSRRALRALVVGIPLAVALGLALILGAIVLYLNARYLNAISE
jgi:purine-cytosine permease-like protein